MTGGRTTRALAVGLYAGLLLVLLATVAWATGRPFVFPSLGPSAYALATDGEGRLSARRVIGGHAVGVVAGLTAYHLPRRDSRWPPYRPHTRRTHSDWPPAAPCRWR